MRILAVKRAIQRQVGATNLPLPADIGCFLAKKGEHTVILFAFTDV